MAKRRTGKAAAKHTERIRRRMMDLLERYEITLEDASALPDDQLRRSKYIGPQILQAIRAAAGGPPPAPEPPSREQPTRDFVTTDQIEAILNVLNMLIDHADRVAGKAQVGVVAARDLLVSKGIVTEAEWDAAVDRVERGHATLFALDPDVQRAVDEIRRLLAPEEPTEEGGEA